MTQTTRQRGTQGEDYACAVLLADGYEILERGWRHGRYEIDVIAQRAQVIAFVEVKTRAENGYATPAGALGKAQRKRIALAAVAYLRARGIYNTGEYQPRFDVFEVVTDRRGFPQTDRCAHLPAAYDTGDLDVFL